MRKKHEKKNKKIEKKLQFIKKDSILYKRT